MGDRILLICEFQGENYFSALLESLFCIKWDHVEWQSATQGQMNTCFSPFWNIARFFDMSPLKSFCVILLGCSILHWKKKKQSPKQWNPLTGFQSRRLAEIINILIYIWFQNYMVRQQNRASGFDNIFSSHYCDFTSSYA